MLLQFNHRFDCLVAHFFWILSDCRINLPLLNQLQCFWQNIKSCDIDILIGAISCKPSTMPMPSNALNPTNTVIDGYLF